MLYFGARPSRNYERFVYEQILLGLLCSKQQCLLKHNEYVVLVYGSEAGNKFPDKYLAYKYDEKNCVDHLGKVLFSKSHPENDE